MKELVKINSDLVVRHFFEMTENMLSLKLLAGGSSMETRKIADPAVNRPALALTGYFKHFAAKRLQYAGFCELSYLLDLERDAQIEAIRNIDARHVPCFVVTDRVTIPQHLIDYFNQRALPILTTALSSGEFIEKATIFLDEYFSPQTTIFGSLIEIHGMGVLLQGLPALPKSACIVALIEHGHTLIADDVVCISCGHHGNLIGRSKEITQGYMEFRGIGLLKLAEIFGMRSVRAQSNIELVIRFEENLPEYSGRTGLEEPSNFEILNHNLPLITLPFCSGNDSYRLVEVATTMQLLRANGNNPAEELSQRLIKHMLEMNK
ncbi:MAG: HPr(Ser) kinase/phosphatase [Puniceicoccales bacterium]|jgi:HPr kinase/phosphorylase|nr:HPr(Ser) kinase/phosphatase [Puniceicoccales bacterium]